MTRARSGESARDEWNGARATVFIIAAPQRRVREPASKVFAICILPSPPSTKISDSGLITRSILLYSGYTI